MPTWKVVTSSSVGKYLPGNKWKDFPVQAQDVGKKYYIQDGQVFIENNEQRDRRLGKKNPRRRATRKRNTASKLIPAKVRVDKDGNVRVFVNPRHLRDDHSFDVVVFKSHGGLSPGWYYAKNVWDRPIGGPYKTVITAKKAARSAGHVPDPIAVKH